MADLILTKRQSERAIKNFKTRIEKLAEGYGNKDKGILYTGHRLFAQIDEAVRKFGVQAVGSAIEGVAESVTFEDPSLYYASRFDSNIDQDQEDFVGNFIDELESASEELFDEIEELEAERKEREDEKRAVEEEQAELEDEYRRELKNLKSLIKRRSSRGINVPYSNIVTPKKITAGSVRKVLKAIESIKTNYPL